MALCAEVFPDEEVPARARLVLETDLRVRAKRMMRCANALPVGELPSRWSCEVPTSDRASNRSCRPARNRSLTLAAVQRRGRDPG
jgi:hypothetical protein